MDFLGAVNRVLVNAFILKGDDDLITSFSDQQHEATIRVARNNITSELNHHLSLFPVPYERTTSSITTVAGQRVYTLPSDFVRFYGSNPYFYLDTEASQRCYEYNGGEDALRQEFMLYLTDQGFENWWYWADSTVKSVAFLQVPNAIRVWNFEYERNVSVVNSTDPMPFASEQEAEALADMASRRFRFTIEDKDLADLEKDWDYNLHRETLMNLLSFKNESTQSGKRYR